MSDTNQPTNLRHRAVEDLRAKHPAIPETLDGLTPEAAQRLLYELRVHQVLLEMQNEELCRTRQELEVSRDRYFDLYSLALVAYFTLSNKRLILEANLTSTRFLLVEKSALLKQSLSLFIAFEDQDVFFLKFQQLLRDRAAHRERADVFQY